MTTLDYKFRPRKMWVAETPQRLSFTWRGTSSLGFFVIPKNVKQNENLFRYHSH